MNVLLTPTNVSSQTSVMVRALKEIGVNARGLVRTQHKYLDTTGLEIRCPYKSSSKHFLQRRIQDAIWLRHLIPAMRWADIVHWRWGQPSAYWSLDLRVLQLMDRCRFVDFCGSDIRIPSLAAKDNLYLREAWEANILRYGEDHVPRANQSLFESLGFHCIIRHRELLAYIDQNRFRSVNCINAPVMTSEITPRYPNADCHRPLICHCPSRRGDKGTDAVQVAIEKIKGIYNFQYLELHGIPRIQLLQKIREADIVLDQFVLGDFGNLALEAMAAGKPVVCYLKPSVAQMVPDIPIVNSNQESLPAVLGKLLTDVQLRIRLGHQSRDYVEKYHDAIKVAQDLRDIYQEKLEACSETRQLIGHRVRKFFSSNLNRLHGR